MRKLLVFVLFCFMFSACYTSEFMIGDVKGKPLCKVAQRKNHYLISGLVSLNEQQEPYNFIKNNKDYVIKTQMSFIDGLVNVLTWGLYTPFTTEYFLPYNNNGLPIPE